SGGSGPDVIMALGPNETIVAGGGADQMGALGSNVTIMGGTGSSGPMWTRWRHRPTTHRGHLTRAGTVRRQWRHRVQAVVASSRGSRSFSLSGIVSTASGEA